MGRGSPCNWTSRYHAVTDFVVIGGGIAGVSAAAHLASYGSVTLLEMESNLAYHTTGRSAALFVINYGAQGTRPLARASRAYLESPPDGSTDTQLLSERGLLWAGTEDQLDGLAEIAAEGELADAGSTLLDADEVLSIVPTLRAEVIAGGLLEPFAFDIDVGALHQSFVRLARAKKTSIVTNAPVSEVTRSGHSWRIAAGGESYVTDVVVNAAGAWGDIVASMAGVEPVGLRPLRRTAFMVPGHPDYSDWPMVVAADQSFYFKPDGAQLLCSLAEEEQDEPGDPRPRMEDVALAIERINATTNLGIRTVNSQWTGLRTFAPDREMVIGQEPTVDGFYWLVGQGGTGIQTSPAYGRLLADLVIDGAPSSSLIDAGVDAAVTSPDRFRV